MKLLIFGYGFTGRALASRLLRDGWSVTAAVRNDSTRQEAEADGVLATPVAACAALAQTVDAILIAAPPDDHGCPGFRALAPSLEGALGPRWIGYLSTTGVYGDRQGRWTFESSPTNAMSIEGARRVAAEQDWLDLGAAVFRLPGIYGPGRSPFDRLREGTAHRLIKPGQVFSRIHVDDLAAGLEASLARPRGGAIYHLCDDEPAPAEHVTAYAAGLLGLQPPPERAYDDAGAMPAVRRFYRENKRISNALAKAELGWLPAYPSYREGLRAVLAAETSRN
ncbi:MAG TPA: SDR family oxidoreductase [Caulobacteraceae bacterium]|nr:SDR family oxidoreductase [Caulobacteraceae bacterium]